MEPAAFPVYDTKTRAAAFPSAHASDAAPPTLGSVAAFLEARLATASEPGAAADIPLVWPRTGADGETEAAPKWDAPVARIVLALEYGPRVERAIADEGMSVGGVAAFLHRPFDLPPGALSGALAVFASHSGFDAHLTTAYNPALARALGMENLQIVRDALKGDAVIGMIGDVAGDVAPAAFDFLRLLRAQFRGYDHAEMTLAEGAPIRRVAVMSALRPNLVRQIAGLGGDVYVTGQLRESARAALRESGLSVVAVGHRRSELWGLKQLARELTAAFPSLSASVVAR